MSNRKKVVAGNWKMNLNTKEAKDLCSKLLNDCNTNKVDVIFCVPFTNFNAVNSVINGTNIKLGAQNFYYEEKGAFTGEISADMLLDSDVKYVIIGHSERRQIFKEDNEMINKKIKSALSKGLIPIVCCGETLTQREQNETLDFIKSQIVTAFDGINSNDVTKIIIAYEPIWAIGTGKTATSDEAEEVCAYIRKVIKDLYNSDLSEQIRILYGGSVNAKNAKELFEKENIDGGLVGGASLKEDFINIVNY